MGAERSNGGPAMRLGILTSGGDCPGLNAAIRAVTRRAEHVGVELLGFHDAWQGVLEGRWERLTIDRCRGILPRGGTILGTGRVTPYQSADGLDVVRRVVAEQRLDGFVVIGGNGSLSCAAELNADGIRCVGIPKTIDNDVEGTEFAIGFDTAVAIVSEAIDRLHTTAEAHDRILVVEVMGRSVGHIALRAGIAGGAAAILLPETPFDLADVASVVEHRRRSGRLATLVVVAEGAAPAEGTMEIPAYEVDRFGHRRLGGVATLVAPELERLTGVECRVTILGHVQRGGTPTAFDRVLASRMGLAAADAAIAGRWGCMVGVQHDAMVEVPLTDVAGRAKPVDHDLIAAAAEFSSLGSTVTGPS